MSFVKNAWYVAMWSENLKDGEPQERTIVGESLVIYRGVDGAPVALQNRCPHRSAPLHMGRVCDNGNLECGYHGLQFDATGACVRNPHGPGVIPIAAGVRSFPAVERHTLVWIWMGDGPADPARIPDLSVIDRSPPEHVTYRDVLDMDAHYELVVDNLLDLSHTAFLHRGVLGNNDTVSAEIRATREADTVTASRWMPGVKAPGLFDMLFRRDGGIVDHWAAITGRRPRAWSTTPGSPPSAARAARAPGCGACTCSRRCMSARRFITSPPSARTRCRFPTTSGRTS
ncbi:Rieske 2Fe-2S domain-containing protein [Ramlibacter terrae]|uniref:Rieske 2Fe-2S domain-containing protein n=1 Tax=Ramlibacter terrae TaxID=2732511 RepID=A0ABX6P437_9BURK|nr:Rieske 2Fe-2S domain-containing protein [Ramlibacter terrae]